MVHTLVYFQISGQSVQSEFSLEVQQEIRADIWLEFWLDLAGWMISWNLGITLAT